MRTLCIYIWRPARDHIGIYNQENKIGLNGCRYVHQCKEWEILQEGGTTGDAKQSEKSSGPKVYNSISRSDNSIGNWYESMKVSFLREQLMPCGLWFDLGAILESKICERKVLQWSVSMYNVFITVVHQ